LYFKRIFRDFDEESSGLGLGGFVMGVPDFMMSVGAWFASVAAIAMLGVAAAAILLRDYLRVERQLVALSVEVARLHNEIDVLRDAAERAPAPAPAPVARLEPVPALPTSVIDRSAEVEPRSGPKRVLLAEDDEANALFAVKSLERVGAIIDWAKDGLEAVTLVEEAFAGQRPEYDLVLMDLRMPHLGGLDATRQIRALEHAIGRPDRLCIAAVTATAMRKDRESAQDAGMSVFISKPYAADALVQLLGDPADALARAS
jgi:CheY-like chemotaxis protein